MAKKKPTPKTAKEQQLADFTRSQSNAAASVMPEQPELPPAEARQAGRVQKLRTSGGKANVVLMSPFKNSKGNPITPNLDGLGDRTKPRGWNVMKFSDAVPVSSQVPGSFKRKMEAETDLLNSYYGWHGLVEPEYDLLEPYTILDTESYLARALERKHSLMFREGFAFTGDNQTFVEYATKRAQQVGYVMGTSFENLLKDIVWNLLVCSNVLLVKIRDEEASGGRRNEKNKNKTPVAGYSLIPPHTIFPFLDGYGHIEKWRRFFGDGRPYRDYSPEDIIHFKMNVKPGHIYGTPRIHTVRDDIFALRRLEENIELLMLHHMFPLMQVKVGTPEAPCEYLPDGTSEIDMYRNYIQSMPKEGCLVTDERVEVDVKGVAKEGADYTSILEHYKQRIFTGLGVSGIDLGETDTANRNTADNVSQNLRDQIKSDLQWFCNQVAMCMLKDWFMEAPFNLSVQNAVSDVKLQFHELDPDGKIKNETHNLNLYNSNAITHEELRKRNKERPLTEEQHKDTHFHRHQVALEKIKAGLSLKAQTQAEEHNASMQTMANETKVKTEVHKAAAVKKTKVTHKTATGSSRTKEVHEPTKHAQKALSQILQPANQHGKNLDPHKARSSRELLSVLYDELLDVFVPGDDNWEFASGCVVDLTLDGYSDDLKERVKAFIRTADDDDMLYAAVGAALLQDGSDDEDEVVVEEAVEETEETPDSEDEPDAEEASA